MHTTHTTVLRPFVWDYPGEPVPEETLTHPPTWSSSNLYQFFHLPRSIASSLFTLRAILTIHGRQHASTDDAGISKHRLSLYNAYYHNWLILIFTASDSSSEERCFLKVLIALQLTQLMQFYSSNAANVHHLTN